MLWRVHEESMTQIGAPDRDGRDDPTSGLDHLQRTGVQDLQSSVYILCPAPAAASADVQHILMGSAGGMFSNFSKHQDSRNMGHVLGEQQDSVDDPLVTLVHPEATSTREPGSLGRGHFAILRSSHLITAEWSLRTAAGTQRRGHRRLR